MEREFEVCVEKECPVCFSDNPKSIIKKYDDRFGQPDLFEYCYCEKCNITFLKNKIKEKYLPELYKKYYGKNNQASAKSSKLKLILEKIGLDDIIFQNLAGNKLLLNNVNNNSKVLEIGSGYSSELKRVISFKNLDWTSLEVDEYLVNKIKKDNLKAKHGTTTMNDISDRYDYIISSQSLEHQFDVNDFFENSKKLLRSEGKIIFTTPNFDSRYRKKYQEGWINWHAPYHITILSRKSIEKLCEKYNFVISKFYTYTPTSWWMLQEKFEIPERGKVNKNFNFNFPLIRQLFVSVFLRVYEFFNRTTGDCMFCEIKLK